MQQIVLDEVSKHPELTVLEKYDDSIYLTTTNLSSVTTLRSIINAFIIARDKRFHPIYINNHKSILGTIISTVLNHGLFKTFTISCAGSNSSELTEIKQYIATTFKLTEHTDPDLKIFIGKNKDIWEIGVCITPRPLSVRELS